MFVPFEPQDLNCLNDLQPDDWPPLEGVFQYYLDQPFCSPFKLEIKNQTVGVGAVIFHGNSAWLAHIAVDEACRRKGYGAEIVSSLLDFCHGRGIHKISLIATDLGFPVYEKLGFRLESEYCYYRMDRLMEEPNDLRIISLNKEHRDALLELDIRISGERRTSLLDPSFIGGWGWVQGGRLLGFYLPDLAEGGIFSVDPQGGIMLLQKKCSTHNGMLVIPEQNLWARDFLKSRGCTATKRNRRMVWGESVIWDPASVYHRFGGNLG